MKLTWKRGIGMFLIIRTISTVLHGIRRSNHIKHCTWRYSSEWVDVASWCWVQNRGTAGWSEDSISFQLCQSPCKEKKERKKKTHHHFRVNDLTTRILPNNFIFYNKKLQSAHFYKVEQDHHCRLDQPNRTIWCAFSPTEAYWKQSFLDGCVEELHQLLGGRRCTTVTKRGKNAIRNLEPSKKYCYIFWNLNWNNRCYISYREYTYSSARFVVSSLGIRQTHNIWYDFNL